MDIGRELRVIEVVEDTTVDVPETPVPAAGNQFDARTSHPSG